MSAQNVINVELKCPECKKPVQVPVPADSVNKPFIANCRHDHCLASFAVMVQVKISNLNFR